MVNIKEKLKTYFEPLDFKALTVKQRYFLIIQVALIVAAPVILLLNPVNNIAFIFFLFTLLLVHRCKLSTGIRMCIAAVDLALVMPVIGSQSGTFSYVATMIGIYVILSLGLNIVVGFTGLLNLGYAAFYAVGAYTYAIFASNQGANFIPFINFPLSGNWFWPFLVISLVLSGGVGFLLGLPVLRLKGDYLAIVTLGFAEIIRLLFNNLNTPVNITNGPMGITPIQAPMIFNIRLNRPVHYYVIVLVLVVLTVIVVKNLENSRIGRSWVAIREDELVARTMGVPVVRMKLLSFSIGAALAGMMGVVFGALQSYIDPTSFTFMESIVILCMVILGGSGNSTGVIIGALAVVVLQLQILKDLSQFFNTLSQSGVLHLPAQLNPAKYERLIFGLILVFMCIFRPKGILPEKRMLNIKALLGGKKPENISKLPAVPPETMGGE